MKIGENNWMHVLNGVSLIIILCTGAIEFQNPQGGFLLWGYIVGILLTIIANKRGYIISAFILSGVFILASFFKIPKEDAIKNVILIRTYGGVGFAITVLFVIVSVARERKTAKAKTQMAAIFSHGTQGIILSKEDGSIVLVNPFTEKMFGYASGELAGKKINLLIPKLFLVSNPPQTEMGNREEFKAKTKQGHVFPVELSLNQYQSKGEYFTVAFVTNVTHRKKNEDILYAQKQELEIVNKELEAFSYSVSHDLRSPLRAVGGYAQILEEDYQSILDSEAKRLLKNIQQNASRMGTLIDDLLAFSKLGKKEIKKAKVDMYKLTQDTLADLSHTYPHQRVVCIGALHEVMADPSLMSNVMLNLLSNAIKYSSKNESPCIEVNSKTENGNIIFSVRDNGVGFDMQYGNKLFGVFQRLHTLTEFEGTGVGLAIAQRIIHKHGGKIWAEGKEGVGATFYFSLPAEAASAAKGSVTSLEKQEAKYKSSNKKQAV